MVKIIIVYEKPEAEDGIRILVDRLWPRGLIKEKASIDLLLKDIVQVHNFENGLIMTRRANETI